MEFLKGFIRKQSPNSYKFLKRYFHKLSPNPYLQPGHGSNSINNLYITTAPSPQNALDIFKGEWASAFPAPIQNLQAGKTGLFEDPRIKWLTTEVSDLHGRHILELGPLEGGHSYMLESSGAASVTAIESNTHAYLKCLIAKELLNMQHVNFLCGDFIEYMKGPDCKQFDIGIASGVLYHMINPVELISLLAKCCQSHLLIWTHYYDEEWVKTNELEFKFPAKEKSDYAGFSHVLVRQYYGNKILSDASFCGGSRPYSNWMYREEIIKCLNYFGFVNIQIKFDQRDHPNGPAFALLASRA